MNNYRKTLAGAALALLFLAACSSTGGLGDILGGGSSRAEIRGTVDYVDTGSHSIYLTNVSGLSSMLSGGSGGGNTARVYYDDQTSITYQGRTYRPQDLERGDQVSMQVDQQSNNTLMAGQVTVLSDVNAGSSYPSGGGYTSNIRGTVRYVDATRRTIEVDRGSGSTVFVEYATDTPVYFSGRTYRVADIERGDQIDVRVQDLGNGRYVAQDVTVTRSISSGTGGGTTSSNLSTVRGTVRFVDASRRTIELEQVSYINGFDRGGAGSTVIVQYDTNTGVEFQGQTHPVTGLERGDVIEVQVQNTGGSTLFAKRIYLVRDVRSGL